MHERRRPASTDGPTRTRRPGRLLLLSFGALLVALPAAAARIACLGSTCEAQAETAAPTPFCGLPGDVRSRLSEGYRAGASPDVIVVTAARAGITGSVGVSRPAPGAWPALGSPDRVPLAIVGDGVDPGTSIPDGVTLDGVAPTVAALIGFERPHPEIRTGDAIEGTWQRSTPRLVLLVAITGVGSAQVEGGSWPFLHDLMSEGAGTLGAAVGALPLDPTATLTTLGTGAMPRQHGVTGTFLRDRDGRLVRAWAAAAPGSVVATLADDLDEGYGQDALVGLVAPDRADLGLIGDGWYPGHDRDLLAIEATAHDRMSEFQGALRGGFGLDDTPDLLGVVLDGTEPDADAQLREVVRSARRVTGGRLLVAVAGTGPGPRIDGLAAGDVVRGAEAATGIDAPLIEAAIPGGLFLDRDALTEAGITGRVVQESLLDLRAGAGSPLFADAFQGYAVSFGRYC